MPTTQRTEKQMWITTAELTYATGHKAAAGLHNVLPLIPIHVLFVLCKRVCWL